MTAVEEIQLEGYPCIKLTAGAYEAILAPGIGNNMIRLRDNKKGIEIFRYDKEHPYTAPMNSPEVYGYPFLYLPNRLRDGILKVSDATYHLPINEDNHYNNAIHGFVQKRPYTVVSKEVINDDAVKVVSEFVYDEKDPYYAYFPVAFTLQMTYTLSANDGLLQEITMQNDSDKMLPCGFCSHTPFNAAFVDGTKEGDYVLNVPIWERWELNHRCLPTEHVLKLTEYDENYNRGTQPCTGVNLDNDIYTAKMNTLDGEAFYGAYATHTPTGKKICYEVSEDYRFWCVWNDRGINGYFCPEPCTWMIDAPNLSMPNERTGYAEIAPDETYACWQHIFTKE